VPRLVTAESDPITRMIRFETSALFQTLVSLQSVAHPRRHRDWTLLVQQTLGEEFVSQLQTLYESFHNGCDFSEMAIDYDNYHDFDGFLDFVAGLPPRVFAFYVLGRVYRREQIPDTLNEQTVLALIKEHGNLEDFQHIGETFEWADDVPGLQKKLIGLWSTYWQKFFKNRLSDYESEWEKSIHEKEEDLYRRGGTALLGELGTCKELPPPIPEDQPITNIQLIPACMMPRSHQMYYGYGLATLVYDCSRTRQKEAEIEQTRDDALSVLRALGDENRLKILRLLSEGEMAYNGRKIAVKLGLSPSVISRHLNQLKGAGLVIEHSPDNRNILYTIQPERISELPRQLQRYMND
jgi:DNA-binding transcriptional ArsR family regulator